MKRQPTIILPGGFEAPSGLYLPTSVGIASETEALPPELRPRVDLIVAGRMPSFVDQIFAYATQAELRVEVTSSEVVVAALQEISFWPAIQLLARFQRDLWFARTDRKGQLALLEAWFGGSVFATKATNWLSQNDQRVLFSEQQLFARQRLVTLYSPDGPADEALSETQHLALLIALTAVPGSFLTSNEELERDATVQVEDERWLRLFVGHGGFIGGGALRNELGRAYRLYSMIAQSETLEAHRDYCPLDEWLAGELPGLCRIAGIRLRTSCRKQDQHA